MTFFLLFSRDIKLKANYKSMPYLPEDQVGLNSDIRFYYLHQQISQSHLLTSDSISETDKIKKNEIIPEATRF